MKKGLLLLSLLVATATNFAHADDAAIKQTLTRLDMQGAEILPSPMAGMKTVITDSGVLYISEDGKHLLQGPLYDVSGTTPVNTTNKILIGKLDALQEQMIVYKAAQEKHVITVFTDITCGYCHKLHEQMKDYNALGITVRYLAFPRQGMKSPAAKDMQSIWCVADRNKAFDSAMKGDAISAATCKTDIAAHYQLGIQFGVQGTPAIVLQDGMVVPGYQGPKEMLAMLEAHKASKKTGG
ncbi:bifunctional protein-disulfide isomerase/oxidoreductase DsbC [Pectobacterium carotovorum subsp. carotovorum]|uniref:bifunctional protein-disulfide isomerase/oxidoreductase DsbC n=1 Tax=Pectobacterium versatile TaxID=2488639 RepID=UPI001936D1E6|nr:MULTISPECIES: bifunctional protein-disulfide isomerase/oxidoreductase DsbC [Pectobacterium]MBQ4772940.1 bifunctional protein-disulfide isomerase/oxidoreductase DsbC [Pectobacterium versatile]MCL6363341.1 bifunctional protein-disulfide isomerase/oxidoreductase DsbC [Pectobacterium carotovorum subsp. carotovorum]MCO4313177.1 bifunctional protein-disulfide isomerase/oxidoreductase DsbC [Pectobacterium versatile]QQK73401.1 bifunctional protein-disulfide isomerase/oxidoreductase DsbC [Pectobacter